MGCPVPLSVGSPWASTRPVDTPGSARFVLHRRADRPPSRHRTNRIRRIGGSACSCGPLSRAQTRSGGAQLPVGQPISARSVRFGPRPGPGRSMSPPLRTTGRRSSCPAVACADTPRDPRHPHPGPPLSSRRGQGRACIHIRARALRRIFRKNIGEAKVRIPSKVSVFFGQVALSPDSGLSADGT